MPGNNTIPSKLIDALRGAQRVVALTGAGISAESGVPTFRDAQTGLWSHYHPEDLATLQAFNKNPQLVWEWYQWRRELVENAQPNPGHIALVAMEEHLPEFTLITQNVDRLHQRAGSRNVIELHGSLFQARCPVEEQVIVDWQAPENLPPACPQCGARLRPDVVWFGESLPAGALDAAWEAARTSQVFFSIGTSGIVQPAALLPLVAREAGAMVVEVNLGETPLTPYADFAVQGPAGEILPCMVAAAWG